jgi:pyruvate-formate lyase
MVCPEEHQDVMVRISGFSAKFVTLDKKWQQALVDRAEKGH